MCAASFLKLVLMYKRFVNTWKIIKKNDGRSCVDVFVPCCTRFFGTYFTDDFKPASVVSGSKNATIEIGSNQQVTVTHVESSGGSQTVFKGSRRPYQKECVLIIDKNTGEITLEKLTTNIQLKKTRYSIVHLV